MVAQVWDLEDVSAYVRSQSIARAWERIGHRAATALPKTFLPSSEYGFVRPRDRGRASYGLEAVRMHWVKARMTGENRVLAA